MIKKNGGKWCVYDKTGTKKLGTHPTKKKAQSQLAAIEINKKKPSEIYKKAKNG